MTFADRLGFDLCKGHVGHLLDNIPGVSSPEPAPIKPGDLVELRFRGHEIDVDVNTVGDTIAGVPRDIAPDLAPHLGGLSSGQEITFREPHVFVVYPRNVGHFGDS